MVTFSEFSLVGKEKETKSYLLYSIDSILNLQSDLKLCTIFCLLYPYVDMCDDVRVFIVHTCQVSG